MIARATICRIVLAAAAAALLALIPQAASAVAAPAASWRLESFATPTNFSAADNAACTPSVLTAEIVPCDAYVVTATDAGAAPTDGSDVTLADTLPAGLTAKGVSLFWSGFPVSHGSTENLAEKFGLCTTAPVQCTIPASFFTAHGAAIEPDDRLTMHVYVTVSDPSLRPLLNAATVSGGGVASASAGEENQVAEGLPAFGLYAFHSYLADTEGAPPAQAGAHPYELSTQIDFANGFKQAPEGTFTDTSVEDLKDAVVDLPVGLTGSALSAPTCPLARVSDLGPQGCPADSVVGHITTHPVSGTSEDNKIYHVVSEHGVAAEFGFSDVAASAHVLLASIVPGPGGYTLRVGAREITQLDLTDLLTTFYGDPAARAAGRPEEAGDVPTFTDPADCDGEPLVTHIHADSWQDPAHWPAGTEPDLSEPQWASATSESPPVTGCDKLRFEPTITATPETTQADSPTGLEVDLKVPQAEGPETLGTPPLKKAVVTLPAGMTVNPSSANGLEGCSLAQIGVSASGQPDGAAPQCPDASKIGTVELETPALPGVLQGQIYVAKQSENPFGTLLALYIAIDDPTTGVVVKLPAEVRADPVTGQLQTVVDDSPQFPFSELRTHFFGGRRAALRTPAVCGNYEVTSELTPWSAPQSGPPATPSASFRITQGCAQSAAGEPNHPGFSAGTVSPLAGAYSPFLLHLSREDGSQELDGLTLSLPPGLIGKLAGVGECPDAALATAAGETGAAERQSPSCPASSEVGTVTVGAGAGLEPFYASGHAYLAGPYKGAPLSLAIVTPALAGPFDLGDVVVRAALQVDPETTQITAVSDPIPHILQGIPLDIRSIALAMDRHEFTLNPTSCERKAITGTATTVLGQSASLGNPFQVGGCKSLKFGPKLAIDLKGATRRAGHPALKATLTYPPGPGYANIAYAQVGLPHSEFLDQGHIKTVCTQPELKADACPAASVYGHAEAWTPLLEKPLEGPVYLGVGYGHKLPDLVADLDGQIRVLLHGRVDTDPRKGLRNTFEVVPDAPVSKFVLELKGGAKGLLENSEDLCTEAQKAQVKFIAQNGLVDSFAQKIANGCKGKPGGHRKSHKHHKSHKQAGGHR